MDIVRNSAPRAGRIFAALGVLTASVLTAVVPAIVSADTITTRSVALSSSTKSNPNTSYNVTFTTVGASTGVVEIDFCDTAVIGGACTPPNINTSGVAVTGGHTVTSKNSDKGVKVVLAAPASAGSVNFTLSGITNPTTAQTMYARIVTYVDDTAYTANYVDQDTIGTHLDDGSVALTITDGFSVNGSVLESLTFCASGAVFATNPIGTGCTTNVTAPNLTLGAGGVLTTALSEGTIQTQVSTNAVGGVAVNLKSSTTGGGLARAGAALSDITPMTTAGAINTGDAKFGLKLVDVTGVAATAPYNTSNYYLGSAATGTYGEKVYGSTGPISDGVANLTFGANISNLTPAGTYSAALSLIATGTF